RDSPRLRQLALSRPSGEPRRRAQDRALSRMAARRACRRPRLSATDDLGAAAMSRAATDSAFSGAAVRMTRIAVLSDIHGNLPALEAVVADAEARGCTAFANLGDILSGPLWPFETAEYLMARQWPTIAGNHERQVLTDP